MNSPYILVGRLPVFYTYDFDSTFSALMRKWFKSVSDVAPSQIYLSDQNHLIYRYCTDNKSPVFRGVPVLSHQLLLDDHVLMLTEMDLRCPFPEIDLLPNSAHEFRYQDLAERWAMLHRWRPAV